jgi:DNA-directed RNA polymerase subunit RPC12/RpoP
MNLDNSDMFEQMSTSALPKSAVWYPSLSGHYYSNDSLKSHPKTRIIQCEYCRSANTFDYKEFNCMKCGAPLKLAKPF